MLFRSQSSRVREESTQKVYKENLPLHGTEFGLALSGCIDGFLRKVLWLVCASTNNDPTVIAHYFLSCVQNLGVIPMRLRTDCGMETGPLPQFSAPYATTTMTTTLEHPATYMPHPQATRGLSHGGPYSEREGKWPS